jgi:uncharacterized protein (DUF433 family)
MRDRELLARITADPAVLVGKPVIAGTRLSVELILNLLAHGHAISEILADYPGVTEEDVRACLLAGRDAVVTQWAAARPRVPR